MHQHKLQIFYLQVEDSGEYECYLPDGRKSQVRLTVLTSLNDMQRGGNENYFLESAQHRSQSEQAPRSQVDYDPYIEKEVHQSVSISCGLVSDSENELVWKKVEPVCLIALSFKYLPKIVYFRVLVGYQNTTV